MIGWLSKIFNVLTHIGTYFLAAIVNAVNAIVAAIGAFLQGLFSLLPNLPAIPTPPDSGFLQTFAWIFPVGSMIAVFGLFVTAYTVLLVVRVGLKWAKAL